jgi:hypothetical protein
MFVEIIGDSLCRPPDRLQLLRLTQPALDAFPRARTDIAMNPHGFEGLRERHQGFEAARVEGRASTKIHRSNADVWGKASGVERRSE